MAAAAAQQGLGQENSLSMPSRLCLGGSLRVLRSSVAAALQAPRGQHTHQRPSQPWASCRANRITLLNQRLSWSSELRAEINR